MTKQQEWLRPLWTTLTDLLTLLNATGSPHLIIGGIALSLLGEPRATQDIDAVTALSLDEADDLLKRCQRHHFAPRIANAADFAKMRKILLLQHVETGIPIDLSFAQLPFEHEAFQRAQTISIDTVKIPLPTIEDLIIMKAVAHRPRDLGDIGTLVELHHRTLDANRIRYWMKEFARVLEMPELYDDVNAILTQHPHLRRRRAKRAVRRSQGPRGVGHRAGRWGPL